MVNFSKNWNRKLDCNVFTTIRKYSKKKFDYYNSQIGVNQSIKLNNKVYCEAQIFDIEVTTYNNVVFELLVLDTGIPSRAIIDRVFNKFGISGDDLVIVLFLYRQD